MMRRRYALGDPPPTGGDAEDDRDRVSKEDDYLRGASVLLDDGEVIVERVDTGSEDFDYIRAALRRRRVESHRLLEGDR